MEYRFQTFDQRQYNHNQEYPPPSYSSSYSSYSFFSSQRPMDTTESFHRELEKERIRSEIIAGEIHRRRVLEAEIRRDLVMERGGYPLMLRQQYQPEVMHGDAYAPESRMMSFPAERNGGGGGGYGGFEAVPFQRRPQSPKIKEIDDFDAPKNGKKEFIGLGNPFVSSGSKRKQSPSPAGSGSTGYCSNSSKKKIREEFSCAACEISATCERGLNEHIAGKKHQAKMEELKGNKKGAHIGLGKVMDTVNKQPLEIKDSSDSVSIGSKEDNNTEDCDKKSMTGKKFRFWCHLCKIGVDDENIMRSHKKGKKHLKSRLKKERERTRRLLSKSN